MRPVPPGPVQRQRPLRPHRVPQAVPLRRGRGRGQPLLRPVRLQAERAGMRFNTLLNSTTKISRKSSEYIIVFIKLKIKMIM